MLDSALGSRIFGSARAWAAIVVWTLAYAEGAGFGGIAYQNNCSSQPLFYQSPFPPDVSIGSFLGTAATIWVNGVYDSGITFGFFLILIVMLMGSRLNKYAVTRVFSLPVIVAFALVAIPIAYATTVHATLAAGKSPCAL